MQNTRAMQAELYVISEYDRARQVLSTELVIRAEEKRIASLIERLSCHMSSFLYIEPTCRDRERVLHMRWQKERCPSPPIAAPRKRVPRVFDYAFARVRRYARYYYI